MAIRPAIVGSILASRDISRVASIIDELDDAYWAAGSSGVCDEDYDALVEHLRELDASHPTLARIGGRMGSWRDAVVHATPMLSLSRTATRRDDYLAAWARIVHDHGDVIATPKLDGAAVSITWDAQGRLRRAATRGDGHVGRDITRLVRRILGHLRRSHALAGVEVRGELVCVDRRHHTSQRAAVSSAVRSHDVDDDTVATLRIVAWDVILPADVADRLTETAQDGEETTTYASRMAWLSDAAQLDVVALRRIHPAMDIDDAHTALAAGWMDGISVDGHRVDVDGVVYRADRDDVYAAMGATAHHPRGAVAIKYR